MDIRYSIHPEHGKALDTEGLRQQFLVQNIFVPGQIQLTYTHEDRLIIGGATPTAQPLRLQDAVTPAETGTEYFLERREMGIINIGQAGTVVLDGQAYELGNRDGLYVGSGTKEAVFISQNTSKTAEFYLVSSPAHTSHPTVRTSIAEAQSVHLGDDASLNKRTIYQFIHPKVCQSCQLLMGLTMLAPNNVWNTMPCHTHDRRMEAYLYFDFASEDTRIFHLMGAPQETRHLVLQDRQAVISPPWSIHSGVGTGSYTFIWGMAGENQTFTDMDQLLVKSLR